MIATEATLWAPPWLGGLALVALWGAWPEYVRPRIVSWRKRRRNARRIGI
jgi:hypothetical protein